MWLLGVGASQNGQDRSFAAAKVLDPGYAAIPVNRHTADFRALLLANTACPAS